MVPGSERGGLLAELANAEAKTQERDRGRPCPGGARRDRGPARAGGRGARDRDGAGRRERTRRPPRSSLAASRRLEAEEEADDELAMTLRASRLAVGIGHATADPGDLETIVTRGERGVATPAERLMLSHGALGPALRGEAIEEVRRLARASLAGTTLTSRARPRSRRTRSRPPRCSWPASSPSRSGP